MRRQTRWRVVEEACQPEGAAPRWRTARDRGAAGAVSSWGSGIPDRNSIRLYWEAGTGTELPPGEDLVEEDWTPCWRESLGPVAVSEGVILVPCWEPETPPARCTVRIDPGMAFGAGDHPTTRLCLRLVEELSRAGFLPFRVLDVGTGTGVLAVAAARLGAGTVDALDIDPFGYASCRRNARLNGVTEAVRPLLLSLDLLEEAYPLVLANLAAGQIHRLAGQLRARVAPGGRLLLSGFSAAEEESVREGVLRGWTVEDRKQEEGWIAVLGRRPALRSRSGVTRNAGSGRDDP